MERLRATTVSARTSMFRIRTSVRQQGCLSRTPAFLAFDAGRSLMVGRDALVARCLRVQCVVRAAAQRGAGYDVARHGCVTLTVYERAIPPGGTVEQSGTPPTRADISR